MQNISYKVLLIEDNAITALHMKRDLEATKQYEVLIASKFYKVKNILQEKKPHIAVVDINLGKDEDGIVIGEYLNNHMIPIIYSTAYSDSRTIERALHTKPLCYLTKPFNITELRSNIFLGIHKTYKKLNIQINSDYSFDNDKNILYYQKSKIPLSKKEIKVLKVLLEFRNEVVLFNEIEEQIWSNQSIKDSTLRTLIYRLRSKINPDLIQTVPNFGFKLVTNY